MIVSLPIALQIVGVLKGVLRREQLLYPESSSNHAIMPLATPTPTPKNDSITHRKRCSGPEPDHGEASVNPSRYVSPLSPGNEAPDQPARGKPGLVGKGGHLRR
jgi:hypothetical protein